MVTQSSEAGWRLLQDQSSNQHAWSYSHVMVRANRPQCSQELSEWADDQVLLDLYNKLTSKSRKLRSRRLMDTTTMGKSIFSLISQMQASSQAQSLLIEKEAKFPILPKVYTTIISLISSHKGSVAIIVCSSCHNNIPQTGRLKQQKFISRVWRLESPRSRG